VSSQKQWNVVNRYVAIAVGGIAVCGVFFAFLPKIDQFNTYQARKAELDEDIRIHDELVKELRLKQERFGSDKYFVQQIAHEIGFAHEGETIYQFNDKATSNPPTVLPRKTAP